MTASETMTPTALDARARQLGRRVSDTLDARRYEARRIARRAAEATETIAARTRHEIRRRPMRTVGWTLAGGIALGLVLGALLGRASASPRRTRATR